jgi:hypothetical protein
MGRIYVAGHQNFGHKKLEERGIEYKRMARNSEEGQGPHRAIVPMMMMMDIQWNKLQGNSIWRNLELPLCDLPCNGVAPSTIKYTSIPAADDHQVELCIEEHIGTVRTIRTR